jgi:hypothetical protein
MIASTSSSLSRSLTFHARPSRPLTLVSSGGSLILIRRWSYLTSSLGQTFLQVSVVRVTSDKLHPSVPPMWSLRTSAWLMESSAPWGGRNAHRSQYSMVSVCVPCGLGP